MKKFFMLGLRLLGMAVVAWICAAILKNGAAFAEISGHVWVLPASVAVTVPLLYWAYRVIWRPIQPGSSPSTREKLVLLILLVAMILAPTYQGILNGKILMQQLSKKYPAHYLSSGSTAGFPSYIALRSDIGGTELQFGILEFAPLFVFLLYITLERARAARLRKSAQNTPVE